MIDDIKKTLWATADKLRANMDAAEYKHLVLGLIFQFGVDVFIGGVAVEVLVVRVHQPQAQVGAAGLEGVGDVLQEDQAQHQVLVFGRVHVGAQLVGGGPERF